MTATPASTCPLAPRDDALPWRCTNCGTTIGMIRAGQLSATNHGKERRVPPDNHVICPTCSRLRFWSGPEEET